MGVLTPVHFRVLEVSRFSAEGLPMIGATVEVD